MMPYSIFVGEGSVVLMLAIGILRLSCTYD